MNTRNAFLIILALLLAGCSNEKETEKTNILFIIADDCTNWDIGCYGSADAITPNIDRLASEGMKFERCYQAAPMCSPTRHNIYTGLYPVRSGAYPNHTMVPEGTRSIVHYLEPLGYRVALAAKRHIHPPSVFDFEYLEENADRVVDFEKIDSFLLDVKSKEENFALMLCSHQPHGPYTWGDPGMWDPDEIQLPPHFVDTRETRETFCKYLAEINYLDGQVGKAMALLEKHGFDKNTLVIFTSEQGNSFPFAKWTCYEAGLKTALIARWPGVIEPGSGSEAIVDYTDLLPTFIEVAGGEKVEGLDGFSLMPLFRQEKTDHKDYSFGLQTTRGILSGSDHYGIRSVVGERYRFIWNLSPDAEFKNVVNNRPEAKTYWQSWLEAAVTDPWAAERVHAYGFRPEEELFDILEDPWCTRNLAGDPEYASIKAEHRKELKDWMKECGDRGVETEMEAFLHMPGKLKQTSH